MATTYYWRIDEANDAEAVTTWEGPLWSFSTQPYIVVDDFETYNDGDNRIYQTWIDGYETTDNGSQVGNFDAPFAEMSIVHDGRQSMPLFYDNTTAARSEAELALAQDWTASGIKRLALLPGRAGQERTALYQGQRHQDGLRWRRRRSHRGCVAAMEHRPVGRRRNLSRVTSLIIGIEGAGALGVVYVDDIRLYP